MTSDSLSPQEAAVALGVSRGTIYQMLRTGILRGEKVGRNWRIDRTELHRYGRTSALPERDTVTEPPLTNLDDAFEHFNIYDDVPQPTYAESNTFRSASLPSSATHIARTDISEGDVPSPPYLLRALFSLLAILRGFLTLSLWLTVIAMLVNIFTGEGPLWFRVVLLLIVAAWGWLIRAIVTIAANQVFLRAYRDELGVFKPYGARRRY